MEFAELIPRCRKGDRAAQSELFGRFKGMVMGICLRYARRREEAEDVFQECFMQIFQRLDQVANPQTLPGWIRTLAIRTAIDHWKKQGAPVPVEEIQAADLPVYEADFDGLDAETLLGLLQALPEHQRVVFNLFAIEGFSHKEIALQTGITELSSRVFLNRARQRLQSLVLSLNRPNTECHAR